MRYIIIMNIKTKINTIKNLFKKKYNKSNPEPNRNIKKITTRSSDQETGDEEINNITLTASQQENITIIENDIQTWYTNTGQTKGNEKLTLATIQNYIETDPFGFDISNNDYLQELRDILRVISLFIEIASIPYITFQQNCINGCCDTGFCEQQLADEEDGTSITKKSIPQNCIDENYPDELEGSFLFCQLGPFINDIVVGLFTINQTLSLLAVLAYGSNNGTLKLETSTDDCAIIKNINGNYVQLTNQATVITIYNQLFIKESGTQTTQPNYFVNKIKGCDLDNQNAADDIYFGGSQCKNIAFIISLTLLPPPKNSQFYTSPAFSQVSC